MEILTVWSDFPVLTAKEQLKATQAICFSNVRPRNFFIEIQK